MSRGPGHVQRAILAAVASGSHPSPRDVATMAYGTEQPTRAQLVSVRRAMHALAERGAIEVGGTAVNLFASRASEIYARAPRTENERARDERAVRTVGRLLGGGLPKVYEYVCAHCGTAGALDYLQKGRRLYCSDACRQAAYRARARARR